MFDPDNYSTYRGPEKFGRNARPSHGIAERMHAMIGQAGAGGRADSSALPRLQRLIDAEAWADAALALAAYVVPGWTIRRLASDGTDWHCTLSCQPIVPDWLDEAVEGSGHDLPSAILDAIAQARNLPVDAPIVRDAKSAEVQVLSGQVLTDNFW